MSTAPLDIIQTAINCENNGTRSTKFFTGERKPRLSPHVVLVECPSARFPLATQHLEKRRLETPTFLFVELYCNVGHRMLFSRILQRPFCLDPCWQCWHEAVAGHVGMKRWCDSSMSVPMYSTWSWYTPHRKFLHVRLTKQAEQCAGNAQLPRILNQNVLQRQCLRWSPTRIHNLHHVGPCPRCLEMTKGSEGAKVSPAAR
ncbi:hypothetical protein DE146DRAFT_470817 [Phaeosphaeria sp. MPI-PUGE-AT-0046c]|nr:hypothetical protein DE146DRAFT_470817 [Phaeosphaeria sp. MPI-PUGE-AT-0046c]